MRYRIKKNRFGKEFSLLPCIFNVEFMFEWNNHIKSTIKELDTLLTYHLSYSFTLPNKFTNSTFCTLYCIH